ncbi:hypothetical protein CDD83_11197 [Cordyceps sp. RAO-2017]|nr:hypothetical protein CDD83_11197 [Cordyceps sp. RAO-2017]
MAPPPTSLSSSSSSLSRPRMSLPSRSTLALVLAGLRSLTGLVLEMLASAFLSSRSSGSSPSSTMYALPPFCVLFRGRRSASSSSEEPAASASESLL